MKDLLPLDDLKIFYYIAESGNMTSVYKSTGITQPTLARSVSRLEDILNAPLFFRIQSGLALTPIGLKLHNLLKERIVPLIHIKELLFEDLLSPSGELKISTTYTFGSWWLPRRLDSFYAKYPNILLDIYATDEKISLYNEVEAAVSFEPYNDPNIIDQEILSYQLKVYASKEYLKRHSAPKSLSELKNHRLIVYGDRTRAPTPQVNWLVKAKSDGGYDSKPIIKLNSALGIIEAVKRGVGIATLATYIAKDDPDLIELNINADFPPVKIYFSYHKSLSDSVRIRIFKEFITEELNIQKPLTDLGE